MSEVLTKLLSNIITISTNIITNETFTKVLLNVFLISVFISVLFFTYGVYIEKNTIIAQMNILAHEFTDVYQLSGRDNNIKLKDYIKTKLLSKENIKKIQEEDHHHMKGNKKIIEKVKLYIGIFAGVVFFIILLHAYLEHFQLKKENIDLMKRGEPLVGSKLPGIFGESFIILIFIAITEVVFISFFGSKYMSLDVNGLKLEIIKNFKEYSDKL